MSAEVFRNVRLGLEEPAAAVRRIMTTDVPFQDHVSAISDPSLGELYRRTFEELVDNRVALSVANKGKVLAAAWATGQRTFFDEMVLDRNGVVTIAEVAKVVKLLDTPRAIRQLNKKIRAVESQLAGGMGEPRWRRKVGVLTNQIQNLEADMFVGVGVTGSLSKRVRRWFGSLPSRDLEFFLMNFPTKPWKEVMDLVHSTPSDFSLPYFQACCFGEDAPEGTLVHVVSKLTAAELPNTLREFPVLAESYSFLRRRFKPNADMAGPNEEYLTLESKEVLAEMAPMEDLLWFFDEIKGGDVEAIIHRRLLSGENLEAIRGRSTYGKLMERIMHFRAQRVSFAPLLMRFAEERLQDMVEMVNVPEGISCAVFGDASASMQRAIEVSTIIGSLLSACLHAELSFFKDQVVYPPVQPRNATEVLDVAETIKASHCTNPATCMWPFMSQRKKVDFVVVVTDEVENRKVENMDFAELFRLYRTEVNPRAKLFFVSFLPKSTEKGHMQLRCDKCEVDYQRFLLDLNEPDLTKLDSLIGSLSLEVNSLVGKRSIRSNPHQEEDEEEEEAGPSS